MSDIKDKIFCALQRMLPQHRLSRLAAKLANTKTVSIKNLLIRLFVARYQVNMDDAIYQNPERYSSFNDFFTRALTPDSRPINNDPMSAVSAADGIISQCGKIKQGSILQAKGLHYSVTDLLDDCSLAPTFQHGSFITTYLSPSDYHRVHIPVSATLIESCYIPGKLFSVNNATTRQVSGLFCRNERLVCTFESRLGPFVVIMVGAMIVAGIETVWQKKYSPGTPSRYQHDTCPLHFDKGSEIGRFKFGSTVILLFSDQLLLNKELKSGLALRVGDAVGRFSAGSNAV